MMTLYEFFKEEAEIMGKYANGELVEVVRCENCKHSEQCMQVVDIDDGTDFFSHPIYHCSYGERKEDDD